MCSEENEYKEKRGSSSLSLEDKQYIHDLWIENSIPSVDFQNGRDCVKRGMISKSTDMRI